MTERDNKNELEGEPAKGAPTQHRLHTALTPAEARLLAQANGPSSPNTDLPSDRD